MSLTTAEKYADSVQRVPWSAEIAAEFERNQYNGCVGSELVSESERVRVWTLHLAPGARIPFHRHVLDYFWTAVTTGRGRQHMHDGTTIEKTYLAGETRHEHYRMGEYKIHDLTNIGDTELVFTTVEFLNSANAPLKVPDTVRRATLGELSSSGEKGQESEKDRTG